MRILGIDYGEKRIGLAISDTNQKLAFPNAIIANNANIFARLGDIIKKEDISKIVIGESSDFSGKLNALQARIEVFISELEKKFKLPVYKQPEFLTSVEARRSKVGKEDVNRSQAHTRVGAVRKKRVDAGAAALILQRYLDRRAHST